jgi:hypothetical protein
MAATTTTTRLVGELLLQGQAYTAPDGTGTPDRTVHRPDGVYLQNDGVWHYWLDRDREYELVRDELGWVVSCRSWPPDGHTYRLARDGRFTDELPLEHGTASLDPAHRYAIRPNDGFELYEI